MVCFKPLKAYRKSGGGVTFSSKDAIPASFLSLPCGQCIGCRLKRSREWALRCVHEAKQFERNSFVTLTFSPHSLLERDSAWPNRRGSVMVEDWQNFAKRVRHRLGSFRFFMCGEYGDLNLRPHYHACIFGQDFSNDRVVIRADKYGSLYYSKQLEDIWGNGFCTVGDLTYSSAAYVARYVMKKATGKLADERYERFDSKTGEVWTVKPEFVCMSRRPGVGSDWFDKWKSDVYPADEVVFDGKRFRPPRYYDNKLEAEVLRALKDKRAKSVLGRREDLTEDRLRVREEHEILVGKQSKREL